MVRSGSQGIPIRGQKTQTNISVICPQNNKWGFSLCPSLTPITSGRYTSYGKMSKLKTTWFESRRGRTEKAKKSMGNMAKISPKKPMCELCYCELRYSYHLRICANSPNYFTKFQLFYENYCLANFRHKLKFTNFGSKLRTLIYKILFFSFSIYFIVLHVYN